MTTPWFAVAGSDEGVAAARTELAKALADSVQEAHGLRLRPVEEGREYPPARGTLEKARWLGAGWPDYPWLFGTDGEYTAFASVAMGQFDDIESHLRALRDVSVAVNGTSGKVVHEVMPEGSVYYGTLDSADNTVYTIRGLRDLADLARSKSDSATATLGVAAGRRTTAPTTTPGSCSGTGSG